MIQIIMGDKGSGKTKRLIDLVNEAVKTTDGDIIFIDDDNSYIYDLRHEIRFVNAREYMMPEYKCTSDEMYGFICGMLSTNYDISLIAMDAFMKMVATPLDSKEMRAFFKQLDKLGKTRNCSFMFSVSAPKETVPEYINEYVI